MANHGRSGAIFRNEILAALPISDIEYVRPHLQRVTLIFGAHTSRARKSDQRRFFVEEESSH